MSCISSPRSEWDERVTVILRYKMQSLPVGKQLRGTSYGLRSSTINCGVTLCAVVRTAHQLMCASFSGAMNTVQACVVQQATTISRAFCAVTAVAPTLSDNWSFCSFHIKAQLYGSSQTRVARSHAYVCSVLTKEYYVGVSKQVTAVASRNL